MSSNGWPRAKLGSVLVAKYGKSLPAGKRRTGTVPVYGSNGQVGWHDTALTTGPTIIVGRKGSSGEVNFSETPCWPIDTTYFIDDAGTLDMRFALHVLQSLNLTELDRSTAIPGLNRDELYDLGIPIPPLDAQKRIAETIDALRTVRENVASRLTNARRLTRAFRQSVFAAAFSGRLTAEWRIANPATSSEELLPDLTRPSSSEPSRDLSAPPIPQTWSWTTLEAATVNHDGRRVPVKSDDRKKKQGKYPYYGASGVIDHVDRYLFDGDYLLISEDGANLLARATPIAFRASGRFWVNNHAHVVQGKQGVMDAYLEIVLNATDLQMYVTGSAQPKLTQAAMNRIPIPLPPSEEQQQIVERVQYLFQSVDSLDGRLTSTSSRVEAALRGAMGNLLSPDSDTTD